MATLARVKKGYDEPSWLQCGHGPVYQCVGLPVRWVDVSDVIVTRDASGAAENISSADVNRWHFVGGPSDAANDHHGVAHAGGEFHAHLNMRSRDRAVEHVELSSMSCGRSAFCKL